ncbi:MAG: agmatinase [Candidatus Moraniibacteriota bacterium]|nr:MAG: agmatinase [Candidatus Moranbacteria bacterium]
MVESILDVIDEKSCDAVVLSVPYDYSSSFRKGQDKGPMKIVHCLEEKVELFDRFLLLETAKEFSIFHDDSLLSIHSELPEKMIQTVRERWLHHFSSGKFIITLGGEHSISIGVFQGLADFFKESNEISLVQIDAHLDMYDDDSSFNEVNPGRFSHACVMRRGVELGFPTVQIGIRTYAKSEILFARESKSLIFEWGTGMNYSVEDIVNAIPTEKVYLTLDIDGLDPAVAPATGTPVPGGLTWEFCSQFLKHLFLKKEVVSADIVEIAPFEDDVRTEYVAAQLCYSMIGYGLCKKRGDFPSGEKNEE